MIVLLLLLLSYHNNINHCRLLRSQFLFWWNWFPEHSQNIIKIPFAFPISHHFVRDFQLLRTCDNPPLPSSTPTRTRTTIWRRVSVWLGGEDRLFEGTTPTADSILGIYCNRVMRSKGFFTKLKGIAPLKREYDYAIRHHQSRIQWTYLCSPGWPVLSAGRRCSCPCLWYYCYC